MSRLQASAGWVGSVCALIVAMPVPGFALLAEASVAESCKDGTSTTASSSGSASAQANGGLFDVGMTKSSSSTSGCIHPAEISPADRTRWMIQESACNTVAAAVGGEQSEICQPHQPQITQVMVLRALRRISLPKPAIMIQPPGGKTLVNFETIFHTEAKPFTRSVRLLGQRVDLEITPTSYTWSYGDGFTETTSSPGREYEE